MIGFQVMIWGTILVLLIYFISKRLKAKKNETFEKRDN